MRNETGTHSLSPLSSVLSPALHRISLLTAFATAWLIFMGGLVTSHHAGLAVPDWPNSFGYNMFLFPPRLWGGGILYEHTHRLGGTVVGMLSLLLCIWAWTHPTPRLQRRLAVAVLVGVCIQGILGGLRVVLVNLELAMVHACAAQAFFCLTVWMALVTSKWWQNAPDLSDVPESGHGRRLIVAAALTFICVYCQLIIAVIMRHEGAGLAIPDIPLAYHHFLPPTTAAELADINAQRTWNLGLPQVTLGQIWIHYAHRVGACVVSLAVLALAAHVLLFHRRRRGLVGISLLIAGFLVVQVTLGLATVYYRKPADVASAHVAVGALVLASSFILLLQSIRLYWPKHEALSAATQAAALSPI